VYTVYQRFKGSDELYSMILYIQITQNLLRQ